MFEKLKVKNGSVTCPNCNAIISSNSVFCSQCGERLHFESEEESVQEDVLKFYDAPYVHESDRKALKALKAIPGFAPLMKQFIKIWNEKQYKIMNLSNCIRIDENQMPEIYNMLPPICEKLGIETPEIYLKLDVNPNAATYGDTNPFILLNSGLLETLPMELIPTVLAHECGHIACHHTLYTTVAKLLIDSATIAGNYFNVGGIISIPLQMALYHWQRCSELSADRVAAICDGGCDNVIELCMRFAGYDKDLNLTVDKSLFMKQADDYREMIESSKWNKTLEFMLIANQTHPFNSVRARECYSWTETEEFRKQLQINS